MKFYTIGYGGRNPEEFLDLLKQNNVRTLVDVRLWPDRASMGIWAKAKTSDKGIERVMRDAGVEYCSLMELGNIFLGFSNWQELYRQLLAQSGELLIGRLLAVPEPFCLMCAEKRVSECHRMEIANYLVRTRGAGVLHLE
jgi:uncharacterized protein (DUF488 family)